MSSGGGPRSCYLSADLGGGCSPAKTDAGEDQRKAGASTSEYLVTEMKADRSVYMAKGMTAEKEKKGDNEKSQENEPAKPPPKEKRPPRMAKRPSTTTARDEVDERAVVEKRSGVKKKNSKVKRDGSKQGTTTTVSCEKSEEKPSPVQGRKEKAPKLPNKKRTTETTEEATVANGKKRSETKEKKKDKK